MKSFFNKQNRFALRKLTVGLASISFSTYLTTVDVQASVQEFDITFTQEGGPGEQGSLAWCSTGCPTVLGDTPSPTFTLKKDGVAIQETSPGRYELTTGSAGDYELQGQCRYTWLAPKKQTKSLTITASQDAKRVPEKEESGQESIQDIDQSGQVSQDLGTENQIEIVQAEFIETSTGRDFVWNVTGCSKLNEKTVRTKIKFNGSDIHQSNARQGRKGTLNASNWPAGTYTLCARGESLDGSKVYSEVEKDIELKEARLFVDFDGQKLSQLIPRPGDRIKYRSTPSYNPLLLLDGKIPGSYLPDETVDITLVFDNGEPILLDTVIADDTGNIEGTLWLTENKDAGEFSIRAIGSQSGHGLYYDSVVMEPSKRGIFLEQAFDSPENLRVTSNISDGVSIAAFRSNERVELSIVDPSGQKLQDYQQVVVADQQGRIDDLLDLPDQLEDGRYTLLAPISLSNSSYYHAYFYVYDQKVYPQWEKPNIETIKSYHENETFLILDDDLGNKMEIENSSESKDQKELEKQNDVKILKETGSQDKEEGIKSKGTKNSFVLQDQLTPKDIGTKTIQEQTEDKVRDLFRPSIGQAKIYNADGNSFNGGYEGQLVTAVFLDDRPKGVTSLSIIELFHDEGSREFDITFLDANGSPVEINNRVFITLPTDGKTVNYVYHMVDGVAERVEEVTEYDNYVGFVANDFSVYGMKFKLDTSENVGMLTSKNFKIMDVMNLNHYFNNSLEPSQIVVKSETGVDNQEVEESRVVDIKLDNYNLPKTGSSKKINLVATTILAGLGLAISRRRKTNIDCNSDVNKV